MKNGLRLFRGIVAVIAMLYMANTSSAQKAPLRKIEQELVKAYAKVLPLYNLDQDSLEKYSHLFSKKMVAAIIENPSTLAYPFRELNNINFCEIPTSSDGLFRIYSWNTYLGGTMVDFNGVIQYRYKDQVYYKILQDSPVNHDRYILLYSEIHTLSANGKTYYLVIGTGKYSTKDVSASIESLPLMVLY